MCYGTGGAADVESARGASRRGRAEEQGDAEAADADVVRRRRPFVSGIPAAALESMAREVTRANTAHLAERTRRIDELVASAVKRGDIADRFHWTLVYDLEEAPADPRGRLGRLAAGMGEEFPEHDVVDGGPAPVASLHVLRADHRLAFEV